MSEDRSGITSQLMRAVRVTRLGRYEQIYVAVLMVIGVVYSLARLLQGDLVLSFASTFSVVLMGVCVLFKGVQDRVLGRPFDRHHATMIAFFWVYSLLSITFLRSWLSTPPIGKESQLYYVFMLLFLALTFRALQTLLALTPTGYRIMFTQIPLWEKVLVAVNEFLAAGLLAFVGGNTLAVLLQPSVFTTRLEPIYVGGLLFLLLTYYLLMQVMWLQAGNEWLSRNVVWVRLARLLSPLGLVMATMVIGRHFAILSEPRTANLLGTADFNQAILALSPIVWMMVFWVFMLVYSGGRGLRQRFLPDRLLGYLPPSLARFLKTVSDMDILLIAGFLFLYIPLHLAVFDDEAVGLIDTLRQQIAQQNALVDSSEQALALIFALPFYMLALAFMGLYAYALANPQLSAKERDDLVDRLPIGLLIIFIITLYLCAVPFSQVLTSGRLPQLPQDLGRILAFDVFIPLVLLYVHYFLLVRLPYGRGQGRWREKEALRLERALDRIDHNIRSVEGDILRIDHTWQARKDQDERINMLYQYIELNGKRDQLNMERLKIVADKQQLAEISETPVSLTIARLPLRIVSLGIPLLIAFKVYEWAIVNDGLREIANNPDITIIQFLQTILEQIQF